MERVTSMDVGVANAADHRDDAPPLVLQMPVDIRSFALSVLAAAAAIAVLHVMQDVVIPIVLGVLLFYALDPLVDRLQVWHVPRALGAAFAVVLLIAAAAGIALSLRTQALAVIDQLPEAAQRFRAAQARQGGAPSTLDKVQEAATEIEKTADAVGGTERPSGTVHVVDGPTWKARAYVWAGSMSALSLAGQAVMVLLLTYFLLLSDDLFKRKLVEVVPTFARKKVTVQVLDQIAGQIERFLLVQLLTSAVVGIVTFGALWWVGLAQPGVWGFAAGVLNSVPYFGPIIVSGGLGVVAFLQFGTFGMAVLVAAIALTITSLEGWLLTPMLLSRAANMNQVAVFAGLIFWSWMWGVWGVLLAVPMLMTIKAVCDHIDDLQPIGRFLGE
jgi:predicted PurR-regulated permease PerM